MSRQASSERQALWRNALFALYALTRGALITLTLTAANVLAQSSPATAGSTSATPTAAMPSPASPAGPQARPLAEDPALEDRVQKIAAELRCLVCQNESIAASQADLAKDLRNQVREQLGAGRSEREILFYMVARYGDFVLYSPPVKPSTWLLWGGPFILLIITLMALGSWVKRRRRQGAAAPLSAAEQRRVRALLEPDPA